MDNFVSTARQAFMSDDPDTHISADAALSRAAKESSETKRELQTWLSRKLFSLLRDDPRTMAQLAEATGVSMYNTRRAFEGVGVFPVLELLLELDASEQDFSELLNRVHAALSERQGKGPAYGN